MNKIRHYVLANSLASLGLHMVFEQWYNNTICVRYYTDMISGSFGNGRVNKISQYALVILLGLLSDSSVKNYRIKADTIC